MVTNNTKENKLRESMFGRMHLTAANESVARRYLDMESEEDPALLEQVQHQDLYSLYSLNGYAEYLKWLHKNKRTEELARYVRFVVEVGGSTAWSILVNDNYEANLVDLDQMLMYLTGAHAEEQKTAIRAELCAKSLYKDGKAEDAKTLCQSGKENPDIFRCALDYCCISDREKAQNTQRARELLTAMYLHYQEAGTEPELTKTLLKDLFAEIPNITYPARAFSGSEIQCMQNYVRTAQKDTPFPQRVLSICKARQGWTNVAFLAGCAFLALRQSVHFEILFRLTLGEGVGYKDKIKALDVARVLVADDDFYRNMAAIQEMLPLLDEDYIIWCLYGTSTDAKQGEECLIDDTHADCDAEIRRMAVECPEGIRAAARKADSEEYRKLTQLVQNANPELYEEIHTSYQERFMEKLALELVDWHGTGCEETARQYLLGKCSLEALVSEMEQFDNIWFNHLLSKCKRVNHLKKTGEYQFYRRAIILETLKGMADYFEEYPVSEEDLEEPAKASLLYDKEQIAGILAIFSKENVPVGLQLNALGRVCGRVDNKKDKILFLDACAAAAADRMQGQDQKQWEEGLQEALRQGDPAACSISLRTLAQYSSPGSFLEPFKEALLTLAENSTDQVQKSLLEIFKKHMEWDADILTLLASNKQKARGFAVLVLEEWAQSAHLAAVRTALAKEKNKKLAAQLQALAEELEQAETGENQQGQFRRAEERLAADIYRGSRKRKVEWVQDIAFPAVHFKENLSSDSDAASGKETAAPEYMLAILAAYADMELPGINQDALRLAAPLAAQELAAYMCALYNGWMAAGAEAKKRWVIYAAAIHGGAEMITELHRQIRDWAGHSRGAIAKEAVRALALNGSSQALLLVDQMARKFKSNQIKNAAKDALSDAAAALGISEEELEDRIVPDFGFDAQMERVIDYGTRTFTVRLNTSLETEVYDGSGKKLKSMPKPGKQDDAQKAEQAQNEFKQMKKQLKLVVASQKLRLEQALSAARFWEAEKWRALFVHNPVMHQFAVGLIWGTYEDGQLKDTFRYMEDGSFNTVEEEEYTLPEPGVIGLVHPLELPEEIITAWKEQLSDYEITQPVEQLNRPVYRVTAEEISAQKIMRFYGKELNCLSLSGKLLGMGWVRGEVLDGGFFDNFCRSDGEYSAVLTFSGCSVGYENEDVTLDDLYFYRTSDSAAGKTELCRPDEVSERYFSEIVLQIARIVGE